MGQSPYQIDPHHIRVILDLSNSISEIRAVIAPFAASYTEGNCGGPGLADSGLVSTYATLEAGALTAAYCSGVR